MSDQLLSWLQVVIGLVGLVPAFLALRIKPARRVQRTARFSHWRIGCIERTRLDLTEDSQL